jgi:hypothetical protein
MTALLDQPAARQVPEPGRRAAVRSVLSTVERVIFRGDSLEVARANAWSAVQEDKVRARERAEATEVFAAPARGQA